MSACPCPTCGEDGVPVVFGRPVDAAVAAGDAGDLALMGCLLPDEPPHYVCASGHAWRVEDEGRWHADVVAALQKHGDEEPANDDA